MDSAAPMAGKSRVRRRWRLVIILLLVLPISALLLGNLILSTPWVCRWAAVKIQRRTGGLDARISGINFTPWSGISIKGLELLQPLPLRPQLKQSLLTIDSVRIAPVWNEWLKGRFAVRSIELDTPRIMMPVELLAHLTQAPPVIPAAPPLPVTPAIAALPPANPTVVGPPVASQPVTIPNRLDPSLATPLSLIPTAWLHLKNASFTLIHADSKQVLLEISNTHGDIPIAGKSAQSHLTIGAISAMGQQVVSSLGATLDWKSPLLCLDPLEVKIGDYPFLIAAKFASAGGFPLQIEAKLPPQPLAKLKIPFGIHIEAESIAADARFRGLLFVPATWQGDSVIKSSSIHLQVSSHEAKFDHGNVITILRGGVVSCVDARLIGDEISLLGNATLLGDGRLAAAARVVANPETAASVARQAFPMMKDTPLLTPLATPQRSAFDLEASGTIHQLFLRLGKDGPMMEFKP